MAKKLSKSEKLDLILSELAALRADVNKLLTHKSAVSDRNSQVRLASVRPLRAKKSAKRSRAPSKRAETEAKPVLAEAGEEDPA